MTIRIAFAVMLLTGSLFAQAPAARLAFEVASIKPAAPLGGGQFKMGMSQDPGRITISGLPLSAIIQGAYALKAYQITGPDWLSSTRFDITATLPAGASNDQVPEMLQTLLEDRFQLKFHREAKDLPVYALVLGKNGLKIAAAPPATEGETASARTVRFTPGHFAFDRMALASFADMLGSFVDRPVIDETNTKGQFKIALDFALDPSLMGGRGGAGVKMMVMPRGGGDSGGPAADSGADPSAPSIFTALQEQLGLKLDPRKAPVETMVIDHLEKAPTEN